MPDDSHNAGWFIFGYLISAMVFYGGVGWPYCFRSARC
jgi:hypothetical protein